MSTRPVIRNPILPGFNPDPSICRVGDDFYIATSTFEWFSGVQIHHSRDLLNWRLLGRPLSDKRLLDMRGDNDSGGIWAPCLTHADGLFWLIYTDVKAAGRGRFKDTPNYLTTASSIEGPWSEPVFLNASGFDPSLFHDDDGRKWLLNQIWDFRPGRNRFAGIALQQYDPQREHLVGEPINIFTGSDLGVTEGPHIYKRGGWYYLMTAEGGTGWRHAVTIARSRDLAGPYEIDPGNPMLTSHGDETLELQKAGHASLTDTPNGRWYLVHLASRPVGKRRRCILGRETCIQQVTWSDDGWLRLAGGGNRPSVELAGPDLPPCPWPVAPARRDFDEPTLPIEFQTLREPADESWLDLTSRPGWLSLRGRASLACRFDQSLIGRRAQSLAFDASTCVDFEPASFQHMAGLAGYYNTSLWHYLFVTHDEQLGRCLNIGTCENGEYTEPVGGPVKLDFDGPVHLRLRMDHETLQFSRSPDGQDWRDIGPALDATILSDDAMVDNYGFTGMFVALCCQDLRDYKKTAAFDYFEYSER
jgi:xylan 1,4-beta-xylosidase